MNIQKEEYLKLKTKAKLKAYDLLSGHFKADVYIKLTNAFEELMKNNLELLSLCEKSKIVLGMSENYHDGNSFENQLMIDLTVATSHLKDGN